MGVLQRSQAAPRDPRVFSRFRVVRRDSLRMPRYRQHDDHSCGFLAALAVVHYFDPQVPAERVLAAVPASTDSGCDQRRLIRGLKRLGITSEYREGLGLLRLRRLLTAGKPVIVTVQPDWYTCDHWTAVRGVDCTGRRILLSNYNWLDENGALSWKEFASIWSPRGGALVCERTSP
jgi:ABC-type bacteriocin/lantibiotic exporter with double-glycine peptidase domain